MSDDARKALLDKVTEVVGHTPDGFEEFLNILTRPDIITETCEFVQQAIENSKDVWVSLELWLVYDEEGRMQPPPLSRDEAKSLAKDHPTWTVLEQGYNQTAFHIPPVHTFKYVKEIE